MDLVPHPSTKFLKVRCSDCGNEQVIFSSVSTVVKCLVCSKTIAKPRGGKAKIKTKIVGVLE
jgi:small subunit ribosomal protein S27e